MTQEMHDRGEQRHAPRASAQEALGGADASGDNKGFRLSELSRLLAISRSRILVKKNSVGHVTWAGVLAAQKLQVGSYERKKN